MKKYNSRIFLFKKHSLQLVKVHAYYCQYCRYFILKTTHPNHLTKNTTVNSILFYCMWEFLWQARYQNWYARYYWVNLKLRHKNTRTHCADHGGIIGIIFFEPILLNDSSKEPEGCEENRSVSAGMYGWFWASVEVYI